MFVVSGIPAIACGPADARFTTKVASAFAPERHTVSILGVYKDGQMSSDAWGTIAPRISPALGASACEAAYADSGLSTNAPVNASMNAGLSSAIDDYARANGPTDELLARLAPAAKGDLVIVFTLAGKLPAQKPKDSPASLSTGSPTGGGALGGGPRGGHRPSFASGVDSNELDISASFFSVPQKRSVGLVAMQYSGVSVEPTTARL